MAKYAITNGMDAADIGVLKVIDEHVAPVIDRHARMCCST